MPAKSKEKYKEELLRTMGVTATDTVTEEERTFCEEADKKYGNLSVAELEAELATLEKEIPEKQTELKKLGDEITPEIEQRIENDRAAHQAKRDGLIPPKQEEQEKQDPKERLEALNDKRGTLQEDRDLAENGVAANALDLENLDLPDLDLVGRCESALEEIDIDNPVFEHKFWVEKFGIDFEVSEDEDVRDAQGPVTRYLEAKVKLMRVERDLKDIDEQIDVLEGNRKEYYGTAREEIEKEDKILEYLRSANVKTATTVGVPVTVGGVTFDYSLMGNNAAYAAKKNELDEKKEKKNEIKQYVKLRKSLGRTPADVEKTKLDAAFKMYYDADKNYGKLSSVQKFLTRFLSANIYGPSAIVRERNAYREALQDIGMTEEDIDNRVAEMDAPAAAPQAAPDEANREAFTESQAEQLKGEVSLEEEKAAEKGSGKAPEQPTEEKDLGAVGNDKA